MFQTQLSMRVPKNTAITGQDGGLTGGTAQHQHENARKSMF
jgi:hypothetical protein